MNALAPVALHQRSRGTLHLSFKQRGAATVLDGLRQDGCLKARFPRPERGAWAAAVTLNTSGGVAGGDRLQAHVCAGPGTAATVASQAAERFYRAVPGQCATVDTHVEVADGARLEWLPQEAIVFDGAAARRSLRVTVAPGASFLGVESAVFGRSAMGETVRDASWRDLVQVRHGGRLVLHDATRLDGPVQAVLDRRASGNSARAVATLVLCAPGAAALLQPLRDALAPWDAGASAWDGLLVGRVVAPDGACLRRAVVAGLAALRAGRPLPRVWLC